MKNRARRSGIERWLVATAVLLAASAAAGAQQVEEDPPWIADAPRGTTPTLDGTIDEKEWADASAVELSAGGTVWLKHDGESLYLGLRGEEAGVGNVCTLEGEQIHMLQASDGLATAVFVSEGNGWSPTTAFKPTLRQTGQSAAIQSLREHHFEENGWVATTRRMGAPTDIEYRLSIERLGVSNPWIAITLSYLDGQETRGDDWPHDLDDGCNSPRVVRGGSPKGLSFDPTSWGVVYLADE